MFALPTFCNVSETVTVSPRSTAPFTLPLSEIINAPAATMDGDGATTVNVCVALLFPETESVDVVATDAVLVLMPPLVVAPVMLKLASEPDARLPSPTVTVPELLVVLSAVLETKLTPAGNTSVTRTFNAVFGPALVTSSVMTTLFDSAMILVESVCVMPRFAAGIDTVATAEAVLFAGFKSVSVVVMFAGQVKVGIAVVPGDMMTVTLADAPELSEGTLVL